MSLRELVHKEVSKSAEAQAKIEDHEKANDDRERQDFMAALSELWESRSACRFVDGDFVWDCSSARLSPEVRQLRKPDAWGKKSNLITIRPIKPDHVLQEMTGPFTMTLHAAIPGRGEDERTMQELRYFLSGKREALNKEIDHPIITEAALFARSEIERIREKLSRESLKRLEDLTKQLTKLEGEQGERLATAKSLAPKRNRSPE